MLALKLIYALEGCPHSIIHNHGVPYSNTVLQVNTQEHSGFQLRFTGQSGAKDVWSSILSTLVQ